MEEKCVQTSCPHCSKEVFVSGGFRNCDFCGHSIEVSDLIQQFQPEEPYNKHSLAEYEWKMKTIARCNECGWLVDENTVHPIDENFHQWFCISCNKTFNYSEECSHCGNTFVYENPDHYPGPFCSECSL